MDRERGEVNCTYQGTSIIFITDGLFIPNCYGSPVFFLICTLKTTKCFCSANIKEVPLWFVQKKSITFLSNTADTFANISFSCLKVINKCIQKKTMCWCFLVMWLFKLSPCSSTGPVQCTINSLGHHSHLFLPIHTEFRFKSRSRSCHWFQ